LCREPKGYPVHCGSSIPSLTSLECWIVRSSRTMTVERAAHDHAITDMTYRLAALCTRGFARKLPPFENRGRGECRAPNAPAASCALMEWEYAHEYLQRRHRIHPAFPHANGFTAYGALSPATNSSCHRRRRMDGLARPVGHKDLRRLDTSNGCQDHTLLPSASASLVSRVRRSLTGKPALRFRLRAQRCRVHRIPS
jgi:hypothetical protein